MLGFCPVGAFAIGQVTGQSAAENITPDKWFAPLSEPPRRRKGLAAAQQQFSALSDPFPFVSFSWFNELSKPASLARRGLQPAQQQFLAYVPNPTTLTPFAWFMPLSEPARSRQGIKSQQQPFLSFNPVPVVPFSWFSALSKPSIVARPGLRASQQQFLAFHPAPSPFVASGWFEPLSDPIVRTRRGLKPAQQQFLAWPPRLLPTPTSTGTLSALETKDVFLAGTSIFNPAASAEIGIVDTGFLAAEIGIAAPAVASVSISVQII